VVPPLLPPDPEEAPDAAAVCAFDAVRLFADRARAVVPTFEVNDGNARTVAAITARLDGLPLAIELAATRTKVLSPRQVLDRLSDRLALASSRGGTLPERQRTLRGAIGW